MVRPGRGRIPLNHEREQTPIPIVGDGGIASAAIGDGRMIPLVILDTSDRPDLEEFIRLHEYIPNGDVKCAWAQFEGRADTVALVLTFTKPVELVAIIEFDLRRNQGILVEQIIGTHGLYIQVGREGDRLKDDVNRQKVIIEVPDTGWRAAWERIYEDFVIHMMRREGLPRSNAKRAAKSFLEEVRKAIAFRATGRASE